MQKWFVYIIETKKKRFYTGITTDLERRFQEHQSGVKGAKFFRSDVACRIVFSEPHEDRSSASKREAAIKKMTRIQKEKLIVESR